jgi:hypothetical protein
MRAIILAALTAAGIGLIGTSSTFAAPASGPGLFGAALENSMVEEAQWRRRRGVRCVRVHRWRSSWRVRCFR